MKHWILFLITLYITAIGSVYAGSVAGHYAQHQGVKTQISTVHASDKSSSDM